MNDLLLWLGRLTGVAGLLLCLVALGARLSGQYFLGGFQLGTLLQVGTAGLAAGCFCLLVGMTTRPKADS